jgi:hypothetical protein
MHPIKLAIAKALYAAPSAPPLVTDIAHGWLVRIAGIGIAAVGAYIIFGAKKGKMSDVLSTVAIVIIGGVLVVGGGVLLALSMTISGQFNGVSGL